MKTLLTITLLLSLTCNAQVFIEPGAGMSTRLAPSAKIDVGYIFANAYYNGPVVAATVLTEISFATSIGAFSGWQSYGLGFYAGASQNICYSSKLEHMKSIYPIAGVTWRWPEQRSMLDLRYQHNTIALLLSFRIGKNHNL